MSNASDGVVLQQVPALPRASTMTKVSWCRAFVLKELDPETKIERDVETAEGKVQCCFPSCRYTCCFPGNSYQSFERHLRTAHGLVYTELWHQELREAGKTDEEIDSLRFSMPWFKAWCRKEPGQVDESAFDAASASEPAVTSTVEGQASEARVVSPSTPTAPSFTQSLQRLTCICGATFEKASSHRYVVHARSCSMLAVGYGCFVVPPQASAPNLVSSSQGCTMKLNDPLTYPSVASFTSTELSSHSTEEGVTSNLDEAQLGKEDAMLYQQGALDWLQARALGVAANINDDDVSDEEVAVEGGDGEIDTRDPGVICNGHFNRHAHIPSSEVHGLAIRSFPYVSRQVLTAIRRCEARRMTFERQSYFASRGDGIDNVDLKEMASFDYQPHQSIRNVFDHRSAFVFSSSSDDDESDEGDEPPLRRPRLESMDDVCGSVTLADLVAVSTPSGGASCELTERRAARRTGFPEVHVNPESDVMHYAMFSRSNRQKKELGLWLGIGSADKLGIDEEASPILPPLGREVSDDADVTAPHVFERKGGKLRGTVSGASSPLYQRDNDASDSDDSATKRKKRREEKKAAALVAAAAAVPAAAPRYHAPMLFAHHL